jgi:hypothetical protein
MGPDWDLMAKRTQPIAFVDPLGATGRPELAPTPSIPTSIPVARAAVDRFAELERKLKEFKPLADEHAELKRQFIKTAESYGPTETPLITGLEYDVLLTQRENETEIVDKYPIMRALGQKEFLRLCTFAQKYLDILEPADRALVETVTRRTGTRKVEVVAKLRTAELKRAA